MSRKRADLERVNSIRSSVGLPPIPTDRRRHRSTGPHIECDCLHCRSPEAARQLEPLDWW